MLDEIVRIETEFSRTQDSGMLKKELRGFVPVLRDPGFAGTGPTYQDALKIYNSLRASLPNPDGTPGIPPIYSHRLL